MITIGEKLKQLRRKNGYSQDHIAQLLEIDQSMVSLIESGKRSVTTGQLDMLLALYGLTYADFERADEITPSMAHEFRAAAMGLEGMKVLCAINQIALDCSFITALLERAEENG